MNLKVRPKGLRQHGNEGSSKPSSNRVPSLDSAVNQKVAPTFWLRLASKFRRKKTGPSLERPVLVLRRVKQRLEKVDDGVESHRHIAVVELVPDSFEEGVNEHRLRDLNAQSQGLVNRKIV
jgi:hypothetical protein